MRYSYEFKRKCVEMYRSGQWSETPEGIKQSNFRDTIRHWVRLEDTNGPEALHHKNMLTSAHTGAERGKVQRKLS